MKAIIMSQDHRASIFGNNKGTSTIELAIIMPVLGMILLGSVDTGLAFAYKHHLQKSTERAIERASAGGVGDGDFSYLTQEVKQTVAVEDADIVVDKWLECDTVRQNDFNGVCPANQESSRYVSLLVNGSYDPIFIAGVFHDSNKIEADGTVIYKGSSKVRLQ